MGTSGKTSGQADLAELDFRQAFEYAPIGMALVDPDGTFRRVNPALCEIVGYTADEFVTLDFQTITHADDLDADLEQAQRLAAGEIDSYTMEKRYIRKSGELVWIQLTGSAVRSEEGELEYFIAQIQDISKRKEMERKVRESEILYRSIARSFPRGAIVLFDHDLRFLLADGEGLPEVGLDGDWMEGRTIHEVFPPETVQVIEPQYRRALAGELQTQEVEYEDRVYLTHSTPVWGDDDQVMAGMIVTQDITERVRWTEELTLIHSVTDAILASGSAEEAWREALHLLCRVGGWDRADAWVSDPAGSGRKRVVACRVSDADTAPVRESTGEPDPASAALVATVIRTGDSTWSASGDEPLAGAVPVFLGDEVVAVVVVYSDSGRSARDRDLEVTYAVAAQMGFALTRKADEDRLREKTEALAQSNADLERFAYVASHDLQEPLRTVSSYCSLLERRYADRLDEDGVQFLHYAVDGAKRMQTLINGLLAYSRVGTRARELEPVEARHALDDALHNLELAITSKGASVEVGELPLVLADRSQLTSIFQNLIGNALKFVAPETRPRVEVSAMRDRGAWQFAVRDNGIGIESRFDQRIFTLFQRLHTRSEYAGSGIGLAVVRRIIERHGGRIWVESEPGSGSTFHFTLPAADLTEDEQREEE